ncbi:flavin reductase [Rhizobium alvei]|uniref:Flavin reductase n=1 Tax=Rhizobium alvei TaxID=1132659 RepID=A0ABT8YHC8_9HYPH|nr:flavin reductase [Rhizobium alvei]MDO6963091.1 flavin reductase [Rhizobium alvei]
MTDISVADSKLYRDAMARYAGHVQLVTTMLDGVRRGVAVTAACSVSDSPPTVLVCLNHNNEKNKIFFDSGIFALNSLAAQHQPLSHAFSGLENLTMDERFAKGNWDQLVTGAPALVDAIATHDCRIVKLVPHASHTIMIGEVAALRLGGPDPALVYMDRSYRTL